MIKVYIRICGTLFMPCIFGLEFHEPLCPCQLLSIDNSELDNLVCTTCENKLKSDYVSFSAQEKNKWTGDFEDFIGVLIEERLMHLKSKHLETCKFKYTERQYWTVVRKMDQMIENFMAKEEERIDAKIESGEMVFEDRLSNGQPILN